ncbi:MAG: hypothetical protein PHF84_08480 [bacterium]|nr:hypothetical protein [bacterium]
MIKRNTLLFLFVLCPVMLAAGILDNQSGVRTRGMGDAFTGIADDINCIYYNPAGLGQFAKGEISLVYNNYYNLDLMNNLIFSVASPGIAEGTMGFSYQRSGVGQNVNFLGDYSENIYTLSYGVELLPSFYAGGNLKYLKIDYDIHASAISCDAGVLMRALDNHFSAGLMVKNLNKPVIRWENSTSESLSSVIRLGAGFRPNNDLLFGLDLDRINEENYNIHAGAEIWLFSRRIAPRLGLALLQSDGITLNVGMSFRYQALRLDYSLDRHYELGLNHVFGIVVKF